MSFSFFLRSAAMFGVLVPRFLALVSVLVWCCEATSVLNDSSWFDIDINMNDCQQLNQSPFVLRPLLTASFIATTTPTTSSTTSNAIMARSWDPETNHTSHEPAFRTSLYDHLCNQLATLAKLKAKIWTTEEDLEKKLRTSPHYDFQIRENTRAIHLLTQLANVFTPPDSISLLIFI